MDDESNIPKTMLMPTFVFSILLLLLGFFPKILINPISSSILGWL